MQHPQEKESDDIEEVQAVEVRANPTPDKTFVFFFFFLFFSSFFPLASHPTF